MFIKILISSLFHLINTVRRGLCCKAKRTPVQLIILAIYRSPLLTLTLLIFFKNLDSILNTWYSNKTEFVLCGDININYLENCNKRQQLDALLQNYNPTGTVSFPMRRSKASTTHLLPLLTTYS